MINTLVRPADSSDHQQLSNLIFFETHLHRHLDWRSPLDWLGDRFFWALEEGSRITAALACPFETGHIGWVRLFVHAAGWSAGNAWDLLWHTAKEDIAQASGANGAVIGAIAMQPWFQNVLAASGFENSQAIVMLEWRYQPWAKVEAEGIRIRTMTEADLPHVEQTDAASFEPLWHNPLSTLKNAFAQSLIGTVVEDDGGIAGYQLTTGSGRHAHLARLAVHPRAQGRGAGRLLVGDLFAKLTSHGIGRLSVNTQSDNFVSLRLYERMGFVRTGDQYPVYTFEVAAA
ncbi:MAG TPA: GNAT family N-acetyltransferase [Anaerolineales bacterium]|nr:GNAT family N-acetyltransferase [Anaerolineales bacterium]